MAESSMAGKQDSLEDSLSSEEWTIIDKKESKIENVTEEKDKEKSDEPKETIVRDDACHLKETSKTEGHVEEGEEAGEKEVESDDVSVLSDESEPEHLTIEDGRIERIEWQVETVDSSHQSQAVTLTEEWDGHVSPTTFITCSVVALLIGIILAGRIVNFPGDNTSSTINQNVEEKLRELNGIEEKLREWNDVKQALAQLRISMPEMIKLKDQLINQKNGKNTPKYSNIEDDKSFEKLDIQNILNVYDDKLEMLEDSYQNFCFTINKINSSSLITENEPCKAPKILSDMIIFKKNLKRALEETASPEKRIVFFNDVEKKMDSVSDSLLSELSVMFSRFSLKVEDRLNKFGYKLNKRLCLLIKNGKANDEFFSILLDNEFITNNCNEDESSSITADSKINYTYKEEKNHKIKKGSYEELKKNGYKYNYKNVKDYKKTHDYSKEDYNDSHEKESDEETIGAKSKGEVKNDNNWKKNKYDKKEKSYQEEMKYNKNEKFDSNYKKNFRKNNVLEDDLDDSVEDDKSEEDFNNNFESNRKEHNRNNKFENYKRDHDYEHKFEYNKKDHEFEGKNKRKKDHDFDNHYKPKKNHDFDYDSENKKSHDFDHDKRNRVNNRKFENKKNFDYNNHDSKFIKNLERDADHFDRDSEEKQQVKKGKEYYPRSENFKESKYTKYQGNDRRDKKDKYQPNGDWQMQRGKARAKQRNSDWYFVRADLRQKARINEEPVGPSEEETSSQSRSPHKRRQNADENDEDLYEDVSELKRRVMRRIGRTWNFVNSKLRKYI